MNKKSKKYKYDIAIIPGDGIGIEVIKASLIIIKQILDLDKFI